MAREVGEPKKKRGILATSEGVAKLSIITISSLIVMKIVASIITGSISIRADAFHSVIDLSGAIIGFTGIRIASKPPDARHPFGHGKAEDIAGSIISGLIFVAAGTIIYQAVQRLMAGGALQLVTIGIYVTAAAIVINIVIARLVLRVARTNDSVALEATARHMMADVYSSCAVLVGLVLVKLTGLTMLDSIVALVVAGLIVRTASLTMKKSVDKLMDTKLPEAEEETVKSCITKLKDSGQIVDFHAFRTRKAGSQRYIDLHLIMPKNASVDETHQLCDRLEHDVERRLQRVNVTIHIEPCSGNCDQCSISCDL
ncbi:MAG: cation transporter [Dehalococcoidia bacterium]|nr:MAG: cation transporter [Dehalococcoidia bacterium]